MGEPRFKVKPLPNEERLCSKCRKHKRGHVTHSWCKVCRSQVRKDAREAKKLQKPVVAIMRQGDITAVVHGDRPLTEEERGMMGVIIQAVAKHFPPLDVTKPWCSECNNPNRPQGSPCPVHGNSRITK